MTERTRYGRDLTRTRSLDRPCLPPRARSLWLIRLETLLAPGTRRRNDVGILLRHARHCSDCPARRLYRRMARSLAGRQPLCHSRCERRFEGRGLSARLPDRCGRYADQIGGSCVTRATANPHMLKAKASPKRKYNEEIASSCGHLPRQTKWLPPLSTLPQGRRWQMDRRSHRRPWRPARRHSPELRPDRLPRSSR